MALDAENLNRAGARIADALELAGSRIDAAAHDRAQAELDRLDQRLRLGVDHTVVALVGGTGSGKSSLFNAISGLDFADVGVIRPTTAQAAACTWGSKATELLDFLGVAPARRIQRESVLDHDQHEDLSGVVLLDLPDHDSVEQSHAQQVDLLLPVVDLLIWVVDPQKYADNVLHERYLRALTGRQESMLVVLNQVDTIPPATQERVEDDVRRLLAEDGLDRVQILRTSVRQKTGVRELRERIAQVAAGASVAARTARSQLQATAARLRPYVGEGQPQRPDPRDTAEELASAGGVPAVAESIRAAVASPAPVALSATQAPARSRIDAIRERWLAAATRGLPEPWARSVGSALPSAGDFYEHVRAVLAGLVLPASADERARRLRSTGGVILVIGLVALAAGVLWGVTGGGVLPIALGALGGLATLAAVAMWWIARRRRHETAEQRAQAYVEQAAKALESVVRSDLIEVTEEPLAEHRQVRDALMVGVAGADAASADRGVGAGDPTPGESTLGESTPGESTPGAASTPRS